MLKALLNCLIILGSIVLLSNSVHAISREAYIAQHEDRMIELCRDIYGDSDGMYGCLMTEFYAMRKVTAIFITMPRSGDDWNMLVDLFTVHKWPEYETYDFMAIHLDFELYLEENETCE